MRYMMAFVVAASGVALAVVIGNRMSTDAMAVVIGVLFGVGASIPSSLLIALLLRPRRVETPIADGHIPSVQAQAPQIYLVQPGQNGEQSTMTPWLDARGAGWLPPGPARRFTIVGDDEIGEAGSW